MSPSRRAAVLVLSDVRSGSTLLDQCLGANDQVTSLGEVHWLRAYVRQDRSIYNPVHDLLCSCRLPVPRCAFWSAVEQALGRPLDDLELHSKLFPGRSRSGIYRVLPRRLVRRFPRLYAHAAVQLALGGHRLASDCNALYDAVAVVTGRPYCVDSSKSPFRFRAILDADPARTKAIVVARDFRGVVHSKMRRGDTLEAATAGWHRAMSQIEALTKDLGNDTVIRLRYEDLCTDPMRELSRICRFLGISYSDAMLKRPQREIHHIGGSPSKFDSDRVTIELDRSYERAFTPEQVAQMKRIAADSAKRWGY